KFQEDGDHVCGSGPMALPSIAHSRCANKERVGRGRYHDRHQGYKTQTIFVFKDKERTDHLPLMPLVAIRLNGSIAKTWIFQQYFLRRPQWELVSGWPA